MEVKFTEEQQAVIDARDCNVLVSAAAGSGKTAVLVERIIQLICSDLDVDHLLVVTFTKAAASQMKEKITAAIQKRLSLEPDNTHLQRQETLIHNAQITTIDSFCQYIIRNDFSAIGLDPSFRVGDEGELKLIREDVMTELLEKEYADSEGKPDSDFLFCMDYFSTGSRDRKVEGYIEQLYDFSMSMPFPEDWIRERAGDYCLDDTPFDEIPWVRECVESAKRTIRECLSKLETALTVCSEPDGPYMYGDVLELDKASIYAVLRYDSYDAVFDGIRGISFERLPSKKDASVNADKREYVKSLRQDVKDAVDELREKYFALTAGTIVDQMKLCDRAIKELCRLTLEYKKGFDEKKRSLQLIDFSDMEHFALQILVNHPTADECEGKTAQEILNACTPSAIALEYRDYYREVLIDEYQDSNNVQEMILKAISGDEAGASERFMVGDVKQSIYKFRLARPEIFMEKLRDYDKSFDAKNRRIDLHKNFRSRSQVLDATNFIFRRIMGNDLGGVDYDRDAELVCGASYDEPVFDVTPELIMIDGKSVLPGGEEDEYISGLSDKEKEALMIAQRIQQLRAENKDLRYKDIVILLRSLSGWDDVFKDVLEDQGIPTYIDSKSGYFDSPEVAVLLNMLSVIDNPTQDIPLVSVMHSPLGGFSDEELAFLRIAINKSDVENLSDSLYEGMCKGLGLKDTLGDGAEVGGLAKEIGADEVPSGGQGKGAKARALSEGIGADEVRSGGQVEGAEAGASDKEIRADEMKSGTLADGVRSGSQGGGAKARALAEEIGDDEVRSLALDEMAGAGPKLSDELLKKAACFIRMIEEFRVLSTYTPVHELLQLIIDRTGFDMIVTAQPSGNQRRANIEMLLERAANFEKTSFKGLFHFVRYIEHIRIVQVDYGEAGTIDENADVVRIMSIHKSKGLEFPVVFVSGLSKEFNKMDLRGDLVCDMDLGIGTKCIDPMLRVKYDTLKRRIITDKMNNDNLGEEIRVLYVALTRAKEKLILTAFVGDLSKTLSAELKNLPLIVGEGSKESTEAAGHSEGQGRTIPFSLRHSSAGYFSLVLRALLPHPAMKDVLEKYELDLIAFDKCKGPSPEFKVIAIGDKDLKEKLVIEEVRGLLRKEELKSSLKRAAALDVEADRLRDLSRDVEADRLRDLSGDVEADRSRDSSLGSEASGSESFYDAALADRLLARFTSKYAYENLRGLFTKTSVSELKKKAYEEEEAEAVKAGFVLEAEKEVETVEAVREGLVPLGQKEAEATEAVSRHWDENEEEKAKAGFMSRMEKEVETVREGLVPVGRKEAEATEAVSRHWDEKGSEAIKEESISEIKLEAGDSRAAFVTSVCENFENAVFKPVEDMTSKICMNAGASGDDEREAALQADFSYDVSKPDKHYTGADKGTAYHRVMELLDDEIYGDVNLMKAARKVFEESPRQESIPDVKAGKTRLDDESKFIREWIKRKSADGTMDPDTPQMVWTPDVTAFLASDIGQRMGNAYRARNLMREKPFMMGISASELDPKFPEEEMVLVQGIIDAFFIEDGEVVLIDYKTDRVSDGETLIRRYKKQIELYRRAIEAATGYRVKESYLYSVALRKAVQIQ